MTSRRADDPEAFDGALFRQDEPTLRIGYKEAVLSVKGVSVFLALAVLAIISSNLYAGFRVEQAITVTHTSAVKEHNSLRLSQDRTSCIVTMTIEERARFRERYQPGAFKQMCPWMDE